MLSPSSITSEDINIKQLEPIEHVLQNPDMYFGDIKVAITNGYTYDEQTNTVNKERLNVSNVLLKMADEILMNASDNAIKSMRSKTKMTYMNVIIDETKGLISIVNNGLSIPIRKTNENDNGVYLPEIAFTNLFSSSNFNSNRTGAGKNGVGASIVNVMSRLFLIEVQCDNVYYKQLIQNNCKTINKPTIESRQGENYVKISFIPDLKTILTISHSNDKAKDVFINTAKFIRKRILDVNMTLSYYGIITTLNNVKLPRLTLEDYANMIAPAPTNEANNFMQFKNKKFELLIRQGDKLIVSFVNNIAVSSGVHIKNVIDQIEQYVVSKMKLKNDDIKMVKTIKNNLTLFIKCSLTNPMFEGQSKSKLQTADDINDIKLTQSDLQYIYTHIDFDEIINGKKLNEINKTIKPKRGKLIIDKLCDAQLAGTKRSKECSLFLCEGDSAAKLAKDGIAKLGHELYGVYPLGGKPLNVRDKTLTTIEKNKTVMNLSKILGLPLRTKKQIDKHDLNLATLRYGKIVMLKDADTDGAHIMALVINLLQQLYPELLKIDSFFNEFITPMIKLIVPIKMFNTLNTNKEATLAGTVIKTKQNVILPFYNVNDYNKFINVNPQCKKLQPIYIKGLGGHNTADTNEYFKHYLNNVIAVHMDENADELLETAFKDKFTNKRKVMLSTWTGDKALPRYVGKPINCSDFIKNDWLDFSYDNCVRSIPSVIDGLKPSQRKVLYVLLNNFKPGISNSELNQVNFKKVFQICGQVAQQGYYHHGDISLNETIIRMAQDYCGSNNLPLLAYSGSFGSRDMNGEDAGAPRYISATIHEVARLIYPKVDDQLLTRNIEDNNEVEPVYYIPIIPMVFVNGAKGIGTGYSTDILQHNPLYVIDLVKRLLSTKLTPSDNNKVKFPRYFTPWYRDYKGELYYDDNYTKCYINGVFELIKPVNSQSYTIRVNEIPFTISKQTFIKKLQALYLNGTITDYQEYKTNSINDFDFIIKFANPMTYDDVYNTLPLCDSITINNIVAFSHNRSITKYNNDMEMFCEWFKVREQLYINRKNKTEEEYQHKLIFIGERARFIKAVIDEQLILKRRPKADIIKDMLAMGFKPMNEGHWLSKAKQLDNDNDYNYLLNMPMSSMTKEKYEELINELAKLQTEYDNYTKLTIYDIWISEINTLETYIKKLYGVQ